MAIFSNWSPDPFYQTAASSNTAPSGWLNAVAAVLLLAVGATAGWLLYPPLAALPVAANVAFTPQPQGEKIIVHISKSDPKHIKVETLAGT